MTASVSPSAPSQLMALTVASKDQSLVCSYHQWQGSCCLYYHPCVHWRSSHQCGTWFPHFHKRSLCAEKVLWLCRKGAWRGHVYCHNTSTVPYGELGAHFLASHSWEKPYHRRFLHHRLSGQQLDGKVSLASNVSLKSPFSLPSHLLPFLDCLPSSSPRVMDARWVPFLLLFHITITDLYLIGLFPW